MAGVTGDLLIPMFLKIFSVAHVDPRFAFILCIRSDLSNYNELQWYFKVQHSDILASVLKLKISMKNGCTLNSVSFAIIISVM